MSDTRTTWKKRKKSKHWMKKNWKKCEGTKKKLEKNMRVPKTKLETNLQYPKKCKICNTQKSAMFQLNYSDFRSIKKFEKIPDLWKKIGKKIWGYQKKIEKISDFMTKIGKNVGYQKQNWRQICNTQKSANLKCFKYCRQKSANLKCFKYCPQKYCTSNIVHTNIDDIFGEVWKFWV